jgi:hypothetical protein
MSGNVHVKKTFKLVKNYLLGFFLDVQHFVGFFQSFEDKLFTGWLGTFCATFLRSPSTPELI